MRIDLQKVFLQNCSSFGGNIFCFSKLEVVVAQPPNNDDCSGSTFGTAASGQYRPSQSSLPCVPLVRGRGRGETALRMWVLWQDSRLHSCWAHLQGIIERGEMPLFCLLLHKVLWLLVNMPNLQANLHWIDVHVGCGEAMGNIQELGASWATVHVYSGQCGRGEFWNWLVPVKGQNAQGQWGKHDGKAHQLNLEARHQLSL